MALTLKLNYFITIFSVLNSFDIICLTKSWLILGVVFDKLFPANYKIFGCDKDFEATNVTKGGGVLYLQQ